MNRDLRLDVDPFGPSPGPRPPARRDDGREPSFPGCRHRQHAMRSGTRARRLAGAWAEPTRAPVDSSADDPRFHPIGEVADVTAVAELGGQDQDLAADQVDVDGFRDIAVRQGSRLESLLVV